MEHETPHLLRESLYWMSFCQLNPVPSHGTSIKSILILSFYLNLEFSSVFFPLGLILNFSASIRYSDCLQAGRPRSRSSSPGRVKNFLSSKSSRPVLGSTQPPIQWIPGPLSSEVKRRGGVKLTTHLQLMPRSRKYGSIHPLPHTSSLRSD
jgi:hypothetical protein